MRAFLTFFTHNIFFSSIRVSFFYQQNFNFKFFFKFMKASRETFVRSKRVNSSGIVRKPTQPSGHPPSIDAQRRTKKFVYIIRAYRTVSHGDWHSVRVEIRTYRNHTTHVTPTTSIRQRNTRCHVVDRRLNTQVFAREYEYRASRRDCDMRGVDPSRPLDTVIRTSSTGSSIDRTTAHDGLERTKFHVQTEIVMPNSMLLAASRREF